MTILRIKKKKLKINAEEINFISIWIKFSKSPDDDNCENSMHFTDICIFSVEIKYVDLSLFIRKETYWNGKKYLTKKNYSVHIYNCKRIGSHECAVCVMSVREWMARRRVEKERVYTIIFQFLFVFTELLCQPLLQLANRRWKKSEAIPKHMSYAAGNIQYEKLLLKRQRSKENTCVHMYIYVFNCGYAHTI